MNLISCAACGVVLDTDRAEKPNIYTKDGIVDVSVAGWNGEDYEATLRCPICKLAIFRSSGQVSL